jgi:ornithine decarboxylase
MSTFASNSVTEYIRKLISSGEEENSFIVTNLCAVEAQFDLWRQELPFVEPFYAVKCFPSPDVVRRLAELGCGFDCASMGEIQDISKVLASQQTQRNKIVYAQPAKMEAHLRYAIRNGVSLMVFDGEDELFKTAEILREETANWCAAGSERGYLKPEVQLLLRVATDDADSVCQFSNKFGCSAQRDGPHLLRVAQKLGLDVVGVSFHVGSGCGDAEAYTKAIADAEFIFLTATELGMSPMTVLDIGGGFPGDASAYYNDGNMPTFCDLAATIRTAVDSFEARLHSAASEGSVTATGGGEKERRVIRYIAEPGRFFVSASSTVATRVYSRKGSTTTSATGGGDTARQQQQQQQALYVDDGVYGTFNNIVYDHYHPTTPIVLPMRKNLYSKAKATAAAAATAVVVVVEDDESKKSGSNMMMPTAVFGPTCDGLDQLCDSQSCSMPRVEVDDWLLWECMGAYTHTAAFDFNGYDHRPRTHIVSIPVPCPAGTSAN